MQIQKSTLKNTGIILSIIAISVLGIFGLSKLPVNNVSSDNDVVADSNAQIVNLTAKVGYTPNNITAKANQNTILRVATKNTFDCSSSLRIPSLNISKNLPATGNTDIALGSQKPGTKISGTCGMGMYHFEIVFL